MSASGSGAIVSAKVRPAVVLRKLRRLHDLAVLIHGSALPRRALDRADDLQVGAAAADIAVHVLDDLARASGSCCAPSSVAACMIWPDWQ